MDYQVVKIRRTGNQRTGRRYLCATLYKAVRLEDGDYVWKNTGVETRNRIKVRLVREDACKLAREWGAEVMEAGAYWDQGLHNKTATVPDLILLEDMLKEMEV